MPHLVLLLFLILATPAAGQVARVVRFEQPKGHFAQPLVVRCVLIGSRLHHLRFGDPLQPHFIHTDWSFSIKERYAHQKSWYFQDWPLLFRGRLFHKSAPPEYLSIYVDSATSLVPVGSITNVPAYSDTTAAMADYLYVQLRPGCSLQEYRAAP